MAVKIFILGRPGSGKSTAIRHIEAYLEKDYPGWSVIHFNDYEILQEMFRVERLFPTKKPKFSETQHGGFDVVDFSVLDMALKELEKQVRGKCSTKDELIFIEFARDDYCKALEQFSHTFLQDAYFLFLDTDLKTCIQRVHERVANPTTPDDHFVSDDILKSYYSKQPILHSIDKRRLNIIHNKVSLQEFVEQIDRYLRGILTEEPLTSANRVSQRHLVEKGTSFFSVIRKGMSTSIPVGTSKR